MSGGRNDKIKAFIVASCFKKLASWGSATSKLPASITNEEIPLEIRYALYMAHLAFPNILTSNFIQGVPETAGTKKQNEEKNNLQNENNESDSNNHEENANTVKSCLGTFIRECVSKMHGSSLTILTRNQLKLLSILCSLAENPFSPAENPNNNDESQVEHEQQSNDNARSCNLFELFDEEYKKMKNPQVMAFDSFYDEKNPSKTREEERIEKEELELELYRREMEALEEKNKFARERAEKIQKEKEAAAEKQRKEAEAKEREEKRKRLEEKKKKQEVKEERRRKRKLLQEQQQQQQQTATSLPQRRTRDGNGNDNNFLVNCEDATPGSDDGSFYNNNINNNFTSRFNNNNNFTNRNIVYQQQQQQPQENNVGDSNGFFDDDDDDDDDSDDENLNEDDDNEDQELNVVDNNPHFKILSKNTNSKNSMIIADGRNPFSNSASNLEAQFSNQGVPKKNNTHNDNDNEQQSSTTTTATPANTFSMSLLENKIFLIVSTMMTIAVKDLPKEIKKTERTSQIGTGWTEADIAKCVKKLTQNGGVMCDEGVLFKL